MTAGGEAGGGHRTAETICGGFCADFMHVYAEVLGGVERVEEELGEGVLAGFEVFGEQRVHLLRVGRLPTYNPSPHTSSNPKNSIHGNRTSPYIFSYARPNCHTHRNSHTPPPDSYFRGPPTSSMIFFSGIARSSCTSLKVSCRHGRGIWTFSRFR